MLSLLKISLLVLLRFSLLPTLIRETWQRKRVTFLLYHQVDPETLDNHLQTLRRHYHFITLHDYVEARKDGGTNSLPPKSVVLTLDDGHESNKALEPVLKRHQVQATCFVCTRIVGTQRHFWFLDSSSGDQVQFLKTLPNSERLARLAERGFREDQIHETRQALTWEEMEAMRDYVDFQSHTMYHPILVRCDADRAWKEITQSKLDLEERGFSAYALAYPNGDYTEREASLARKAGYQCALTADLGFNTADTDMYRLKRITIRDEAGTTELLVRASGLWGALRKLVRGRP